MLESDGEQLTVLDLTCGRCLARPGDKCVTSRGMPTVVPHAARRSRLKELLNRAPARTGMEPSPGDIVRYVPDDRTLSGQLMADREAGSRVWSDRRKHTALVVAVTQRVPKQGRYAHQSAELDIHLVRVSEPAWIQSLWGGPGAGRWTTPHLDWWSAPPEHVEVVERAAYEKVDPTL